MTTEPLPTPGAGTPPSGGQNRIILILVILAVLLLLTVVAVVFLLIGRGTAGPVAGETPTVSASPTPTAEEQPDESPVPVDNSTRFTAFSADLTVECDPTGEQDKPEITFSWTAVNAVEAWYTPSDDDAKDDGYLQFPNANAGTQNDLTDEHLFPCNHDQFLDVTVTLVGPAGEHVSHRVVYEDVNWQG